MLYPVKKIALLLVLSFFAFSNAVAQTKVITADITNIEPIYMNYTLNKVTTPCQSREPGCWRVEYQKKAAKVLQGYRIKLVHKNSQFTTRMSTKPNNKQLQIRVRSDLIDQPSNVAINAAVAY